MESEIESESVKYIPSISNEVTLWPLKFSKVDFYTRKK